MSVEKDAVNVGGALFGTAFGTVLGFCLSQGADYLRMLTGVGKEIDNGIEGCEVLVKRLDENEISFSHVYTGYWDSIRNQVAQYFPNDDLLVTVHRAYQIFDLINFNMDRSNFTAGQAMAKTYLKELLEINLRAKNMMPGL